MSQFGTMELVICFLPPVVVFGVLIVLILIDRQKKGKLTGINLQPNLASVSLMKSDSEGSAPTSNSSEHTGTDDLAKPRLENGHEATPGSVPSGETFIFHYPRNLAAEEFAMEPRKTMAELTAAGRAELRTCGACHQQTPFPTDTPPCGIALICQNCGAPLMHINPDLDHVRPEIVKEVFGYQNRGLLNVACPWCNNKNYAITAPANSVLGTYYVDIEPRHPQPLFLMQVDCVHCEKEFWIEWA